MKRFKSIYVLILSVFASMLLLFYLYSRTKQVEITEKDYLYSIAEDYLVCLEQPKFFFDNKDAKSNYNISDFKVFTDIAKLGIAKNRRYLLCLYLGFG